MSAGFADLRYNLGVEGNKVSLFVGSRPLSTVTPDSLDQNRQNVDSGPLHWGHPMNSGVYEIVNTVNGHRYIGKSVSVTERLNWHRSHLRRDSHRNQYLQNAWNKYGEAAFEFRLLFRCDRVMLAFYEQRAIDVFNPEYNNMKTSPEGVFEHTNETKAKISEALRGGSFSPDHKARISKSVAQAWTDERREALSMARKGENHPMWGAHLSDVHKAKTSAALKGKIRGPRGPMSEAQKTKISAALKGRPLTDIHKANVSAGVKAYRARQRAEADELN